MSDKRLISLIVPMYNEAEGLDLLFQSLRLVIEQNDHFAFHIDCINDGSTDSTLSQLLLWQRQLPQIRVINLSRNFGKEAALTAGIDYALGDAVIPLDADLQDPPALIPQMLALWQDGFQVILARRQQRNEEGWLKPTLARLFYKFINKLSATEIPENVGDFRLMDRAVIEVIKSMPERNRFMKGLMIWPGFKTSTIYFSRPRRAAGSSKLSFLKLLRLACDGVFAFSAAPLRMWSYIGLSTAGVSFAYGVYMIAKALIDGGSLPSHPALMVAVLFTSGMQLLSVGMVGEYVARIYEEAKQRPIYVIDKVYT